jgi:hypothetical protein
MCSICAVYQQRRERKSFEGQLIRIDHRRIVGTPEQLLMGKEQALRIRIRTHLKGFEILPDRTIIRLGRNLGVCQCSFLAFGRWFYNRICSVIEGDYERLPSLEVATGEPGVSSLEQLDLVWFSVEAALAQINGSGSGPTSETGNDTRNAAIRPQTAENMMCRLCDSLTPRVDLKPESRSIVFSRREDQSKYDAAVGQAAKDQAWWSAQIYTARQVVGTLKSKE